MQIKNIQMYRQGIHRMRQSGFTLVELVLVIVIMSGITMIVAFSAQRAIDKVNYETTKAKMDNIAKALDSFMAEAGRLPCPADPTITDKKNANYGREACGLTWTNALISPQARTRPMTTSLAAYVPGTSAVGDDTNSVAIGRLPSYVQLNGVYVPLSRYVPALDRIGGSLILDQTGELPRYAVTRRLAMVKATGDYGNITLRDETGANVAGTSNDARYVVVLQSYRNGGCRGSDPDRDFENCNDDSIFVIAPRALGSGTDYFDDVVLYNNTIYDNKWLAGDVDLAAGNKAAVYIDSTVRNIGVQKTNPTAKLDVANDLRADVNVRAPLVCDKPGSPENFGDSSTTLTYHGVYNNTENVVVTKTSGATTTTLVAGTDYTVGAYDTANGSGTITLTAAPTTGDSFTVTAGICLDPLSTVRSFSPQVLNPSTALQGKDSMTCPKFNFSTSDIRNDNNWWKNPGGYTDTTFYNNTNYNGDTSLVDIIDANTDSIRLVPGVTVNPNGTVHIGTKDYRILNFRQPYIYVPTSKYYMNSDGGLNYKDMPFYLNEDPAPLNQSYTTASFGTINYRDTITGTDIRFEAPNLIRTVGSAFGSGQISAGDLITISGSVSNNGDYIVTARTGNKLTVTPSVQTESAGPQIGITRKMRSENKKQLTVYKSVCSYLKEIGQPCIDTMCAWDSPTWSLSFSSIADGIDGTNKVFSTAPRKFKALSSVVVLITPPGGTERQAIYGTDYTVSGGNGGNNSNPEDVGTVRFTVAPAVGTTLKIQRNYCSSNTSRLLVGEPAGGLIPQNHLRYAVYGERYLTGTTIDANGVMQPICEDLKINAPSAPQTCGTKSVRGVKTDGSAICNN